MYFLAGAYNVVLIIFGMLHFSPDSTYLYITCQGSSPIRHQYKRLASMELLLPRFLDIVADIHGAAAGEVGVRLPSACRRREYWLLYWSGSPSIMSTAPQCAGSALLDCSLPGAGTNFSERTFQTSDPLYTFIQLPTFYRLLNIYNICLVLILL